MDIRKPRRVLWGVEECIHSDCANPPLARSLCSKHYQYYRNHNLDLPPKVRKPLESDCLVAECKAPPVTYKKFCARHRAWHRRYALDAEDMADIEKRLMRGCEVCGSTERLHLDHDHSKGPSFRGVLCFNCNTTLGKVNDNVDTLRAMIAYLEGSKE